MIPTRRPRPRRRLALALVVCLAAFAGRGADAAPVLHGTLEVEVHGLLAWPMGIASLMLTGVALPAWWAQLTRQVKVPDVATAPGVHIENDYLATVRFTLVPGPRGYHLSEETVDYQMRDFSHLEGAGGPSMTDHLWASGRIRYAHGRWVDPPPGWKVTYGPRLDLSFDRAGHFHLEGDLLHPVRVEGHSEISSPMGAVVLDGKGDHLVIRTKLPFDASKIPANAGPLVQLFKAAGRGMPPVRIDAPEPMRWPVDLTGDAIGESIQVVRTLPLPGDTQVVTWLSVGP